MSEGSTIPLSLAQRDFVFPRGNMNASIRLKGEISVPALRRALALILNRHEGLRMRLVSSGAEPRQRIAEEIDSHDLPIVEMENFAEAEQRLSACLRAPVDLARDGPLHSELLRIGEDDHVLVLAIHTIATDSHAIGLLLRELLIAYDCCSRDHGLSLGPALRYSDHILGEARLGERLSGAQLQFWRPILSAMRDPIPRPERRPGELAGRSRSAVSSITGREARHLHEFASVARVSFAATLHAVIFLSLWSLYSTDDVTATVTYSGRDSRELETLCAKTARLFPVRVRVDAGLSLARFAQHVQSAYIRGVIASRPPFTLERAAAQALDERPQGSAGTRLIIADNRMSERGLIVPTPHLSVERVLVGPRPYEGLEDEAAAPFRNALVLSVIRDPTLEARRPVVFVGTFYTSAIAEREARRLLDRMWVLARLTCPANQHAALAELVARASNAPNAPSRIGSSAGISRAGPDSGR